MSSTTDDYIVSETNKAIASALQSLDEIREDLIGINPMILAEQGDLLVHAHEFMSKLDGNLTAARIGTLLFSISSLPRKEVD